MGKIGLIAVIGVSLIALLGIVMYFNFNNKFTMLNNQLEAQVEADKVIYDEMWKVLKQQAGVSEKYSEDFRKNYKDIMSSRNYGGEMMKWVTEQNPNFTPDLYAKLMNSIEAQRSKFTENQKRLIDIHREMKNVKMLFPSSLFLSSREVPSIDDLIVTSTITEQVFSSGSDDDIELFKKDTIK